MFWLCGFLAAFFGFLWFITTLSRLREFGWSFWWIIPFVFTWLGLVWIFWWHPGKAAIAVLAVWIASQSFLILKDGRPDVDVIEAEERA